MQEVSRDRLNLPFPKHYLQRLEEYHKRQTETISKPRRVRKRPATPKVFSNNCKQAISLANRVYCCALKELIDGVLCKGCPCYEREPMEYSLFRRE